MKEEWQLFRKKSGPELDMCLVQQLHEHVSSTLHELSEVSHEVLLMDRRGAELLEVKFAIEKVALGLSIQIECFVHCSILEPSSLLSVLQ